MSLSQKRSVFCLIVFIICFLFKWAEMQKWNEVHLNNLVVATADSFHWLKEAQKPISQNFRSEEEEIAYWNSIKVSDRDDGKSGY
jgi:hypothetical protein